MLFIPIILKRIGRSFGLLLQWYSFLRNPGRVPVVNPMVNRNHALVNFFQVGNDAYFVNLALVILASLLFAYSSFPS